MMFVISLFPPCVYYTVYWCVVAHRQIYIASQRANTRLAYIAEWIVIVLLISRQLRKDGCHF